jgi:uncharacterized membrane protein YwzB
MKKTLLIILVLVAIAIAGLIGYFFPEFFNVSTDWDRMA